MKKMKKWSKNLMPRKCAHKTNETRKEIYNIMIKMCDSSD